MLCQICQKQTATVHVTEISSSVEKDGASSGSSVEQRHLCERCAQRLKLPHSPVATKKGVAEVWKLLQQSARRAREEGGLACPDCGMTLSEFRSKGRFGCPKDYEVFAEHLDPLLLRIHNATQHRGRVPGLDEGKRERVQHLTQLQEQLEKAIRDEAYESAAQLRDEIQSLETQPEGKA